MSLVFDQATHSYERDGVRLPSVTQVLKSVGIIDPDKYASGAAARGTAVHLACQYLDEGDLDEATIAPELTGYLAAYRKFLADTGWKWIGIEHRLAHKSLNYAGTIDRISVDLVLDIKSGQPEDWHRLQAAAYLAMLENPMGRTRYGLYLGPRGTYGLTEYTRREFPRDWAVFQSALNIHNWRGKNNGNATGGTTGGD
jgi:hypothetical protein